MYYSDIKLSCIDEIYDCIYAYETYALGYIIMIRSGMEIPNNKTVVFQTCGLTKRVKVIIIIKMITFSGG